MPPASFGLVPTPPWTAWLITLAAQNLLGLKGGSSLQDQGGSMTAPSGQGVHVDQLA